MDEWVGVVSCLACTPVLTVTQEGGEEEGCDVSVHFHNLMAGERRDVLLDLRVTRSLLGLSEGDARVTIACPTVSFLPSGEECAVGPSTRPPSQSQQEGRRTLVGEPCVVGVSLSHTATPPARNLRVDVQVLLLVVFVVAACV